MSKIQVYRLQPKAGERATLLAALNDLAGWLASMPGSDGSELLAAIDEAGPIVFIERWASDAAHAASAASMPKPVFGIIMAAIEGKPEVIACRPA